MAFLQRVIRGTLRRAKTALERPPQMARIRAAAQQLQQAPVMQPPTGTGSQQQPYHPHLEERFNSHPVPSEDEQARHKHSESSDSTQFYKEMAGSLLLRQFEISRP